ncbi:hypothetical protein AVEN_153400-1 [Araneus ventricosus]|uniref:Uncharacterized protein n=1 Tax=Araneus ventricosus TaxID=182803 RepID=A0A4Y2EBL6_ARAVE|nr:hypothetical protein AVEN_153400-1 [Araneus ventricosus]
MVHNIDVFCLNIIYTFPSYKRHILCESSRESGGQHYDKKVPIHSHRQHGHDNQLLHLGKSCTSFPKIAHLPYSTNYMGNEDEPNRPAALHEASIKALPRRICLPPPNRHNERRSQKHVMIF